MSTSNIISAFRTAGLIPFNRHKVLIHMPNFQERDCESDQEIYDEMTLTAMSDVVQQHPFACVPTTPSRIDPAILKEANTALLANIQAGVLDTPTRAFIPKLATFAEFSSTQVVIANHENRAKENIIRRRRETLTSKYVVLKDQCIITTEEIYEKLQACEKATYERKTSSGRGQGKSASARAMDIATDGEGSEQVRNNVIGAASSELEAVL